MPEKITKACVGGLWMAKVGPREVAITAGLFYGTGVILASLTGRGQRPRDDPKRRLIRSQSTEKNSPIPPTGLAA